MESNITKSTHKKLIIYKIISVLMSVLPLGIYSIVGFVNGEVHQKLALGFSIIISMLFVIVNIIFKRNIRCTIWIMLLGLYLCLDNLTALLIIIAITTILDEFIFEPLCKKYGAEYKINKEIDKRGTHE